MFGEQKQTIMMPLATGGYAVYDITFRCYVPAPGVVQEAAGCGPAVSTPTAIEPVRSGLPDSMSGLSAEQRVLIGDGKMLPVSKLASTDPRLLMITFDMEQFFQNNKVGGFFAGKSAHEVMADTFGKIPFFKIGSATAPRFGLSPAALQKKMGSRFQFVAYSVGSKDRYKSFSEKCIYRIDLGMGLTVFMGNTTSAPMLHNTVANIAGAIHEPKWKLRVGGGGATRGGGCSSGVCR